MSDAAVVVTGAAGALGRAVVAEFLGQGRVVIALDRAGEQLDALGQDAPDRVVIPFAVDLADRAAVAAVWRRVDEVAEPSAMVAVAGGFVGGQLHDVEPGVLEAMLQSNFVATLWSCQAAAPRLSATGGGSIVTVGSKAAVSGAASVAYATSKAAVVRLTELLAEELRPARVSAGLGLVVESSGSTGKGREVHYLSRRDTDRTASAWARYLANMGVTPWDAIAICFPIGMAGGGIRHMLAYGRLGATVLRIGGLSSERKIEAIRHYRASTLVATPAYVDHLGVVAGECGVQPRQLGIRRIVVATQSVSSEWVRSTEELWGAGLFEWYGTSAGIAAFACARGMVDGDQHGTLHWDPQVAVQEVVDPKTGRHVADGERGEMIGTPLINEAEPLFRIATGDEVRFRAPGSCACGSPWPGIESGTVRRLDAMFKVKGVNLWPATVDALVLGRDEVLDYRARIWQDERGRERLGLELLTPAGVSDQLVEPLTAQLREHSGLSFEIAVVERREAWTQQTAGEAGKAKRWIDERAAQQ